MKSLFYTAITILALSVTSCNGVLRQDITLEKDGSGTVVYTMDYSSGMDGMGALGTAMQELGNTMGDAFNEMEEQESEEEEVPENYDYEVAYEDDEETKENPFSDMKMRKDTTFTIAAFMKANKDSIIGDPYYTKSRLAALTKLGNVRIHEVNDLKKGSFFMEVITDFKSVQELEIFESTLAELISADKSMIQDEDGPKTSIDGFSPSMLGLFVAANGVNGYTYNKATLIKQPKKSKVIDEFYKAYESLFGDEPMAAQMLKSFLPKTYEVNITLKDNTVKWISDTDAYIKGDFKTIRRTYDFNELVTGQKNTALELRFNE